MLSVCSVQFKAVCDGIKAAKRRVVVEGDEVNLDWTCGAFITMNPGYLGRSELPEGLKVRRETRETRETTDEDENAVL